MAEEDLRAMPYDLEAEEAVLGSCLIDSNAIYQVPWLRPDHFYRDKNQWVFEAICVLRDRKVPPNQITVAHEISQVGHLEALGGSDYLSNLVMQVPTSVHIAYYGEIVYRLAAYREMIRQGQEIEDIGYRANSDFPTSLEKAESTLGVVRAEYPVKTDDVLTHDESLDTFYEKQKDTMEMLAAGGQWLSTPWVSYNEVVRLRPEGVSVIAGPSSHGKTTIATNIADYAAMKLGMNGMYIFNELNNYMIQSARACRHITVMDSNSTRQMAPSIRDIEDGKYYNHPAMLQHLDEMKAWPGSITHCHALNWSVYQIGSEIRQQALKGNADFVIVDYAQLIPRDNLGKSNITDARALGIIITHLKYVCASLPGKPHLFILSQVTKGINTKDDCTLDKLRDSGEIGEYSNTATIVFSQHRATQGRCAENCTMDRGTTEPGKCNRHCLWAVVVKNTFGPCGFVLLKHIPWRFKIIDSDGYDWIKREAFSP